MPRIIDPHRILHDAYAQTAQLLAWSDTQAEGDYADRLAHLTSALSKILRSSTPQADYSREIFTAEIKRLQAVLDADHSVERERAAYLEAAQAVDACNAVVAAADTVDGLVHAQAALELATRKSRAARAAFIEAAIARKLPSLSVAFGPIVQSLADRETRELARHGQAVADIDGEPDTRQTSEARQAIDVARAHGQAAVSMGRTVPTVAYWSIVEADYAEPEEAPHRKLFEARWVSAAPLLGFERPAPIEWHAPAAE